MYHFVLTITSATEFGVHSDTLHSANQQATVSLWPLEAPWNSLVFPDSSQHSSPCCGFPHHSQQRYDNEI